MKARFVTPQMKGRNRRSPLKLASKAHGLVVAAKSARLSTSKIVGVLRRFAARFYERRKTNFAKGQSCDFTIDLFLFVKEIQTGWTGFTGLLVFIEFS